MSTSSVQTIRTHMHGDDATIRDYFDLLKPRVMSLVIFTSLCGLFLAPGHIHPLIGFIAILCIAIGAGASGCLNQWFEIKTDGKMKRTQNRPLPAARVDPDSALTFGLMLSIGSVIMMFLAVGAVPSALLAFTIFFYAVVYTMWLKPNTSQNIVIGGASGALPPVIGYASVTHNVDAYALGLFLIIFLWTPAHFWALALNCKSDYENANIPMLPSTHGDAHTRIWILVYTVLTVISTYIPHMVAPLGMVTLLSIHMVNAGFIVFAVQILRKKTQKSNINMFLYSIFYLFFVFLALSLDKVFLG